MPFDWEQFDRDLDDAIDTGVNETDRQLAGRASQLTRMTEEEVQELFSAPADLKKLSRLMKIVKSGEARNTKVNRIVDNAEEFGSVVFTLLDKLV